MVNTMFNCHFPIKKPHPFNKKWHAFKKTKVPGSSLPRRLPLWWHLFLEISRKKRKMSIVKKKDLGIAGWISTNLQTIVGGWTNTLEKYMQPSNWDHFPNSLGGKYNIIELPLPPASFRRFLNTPGVQGNGTAQSTKFWLVSFNSMEISFKENIACHSHNRSVANLFLQVKIQANTRGVWLEMTITNKITPWSEVYSVQKPLKCLGCNSHFSGWKNPAYQLNLHESPRTPLADSGTKFAVHIYECFQK